MTFGPCGKLQRPPSRWTQSPTLLVERRIIPNSTKIHWRIQNYSYEFGCQAREAHWWLLEHWWLSRLVWPLDRFHTIYSTRWKTSWWMYMVRGEIDEETTYIHARLFVARNLEINGKECQAEGEAKVVFILTTHENCEGSISSTQRIRNSRKPLRTRVRNWKHQWLMLYPAKFCRRIVGVVHPQSKNITCVCSWSQWIQLTAYGRICAVSSWGPCCRKRKQFSTP